MNLIVDDLTIPIEKDGMNSYVHAASGKLGINDEVSIVRILSKALDLGDQEQFNYILSIAVSVPDDYVNKHKFPVYSEEKPAGKAASRVGERPLIIGFGPAGMFAAIELIDCGLKPVIFERGKKIGERTVDVQKFIKERKLNPESNIQFGEGGAGSYSDGKLFSRRNHNTTYVSRVLETFIKFGAPEEIGYISKPHLGTDMLRKIVRNIRQYILDNGGEIHYGAKMTDILISDQKTHGIIINNEKEYLSSSIFVALGHSARDTVEMLHRKGVAIEQRQISVGVRIEHPVEVINFMRYGKKYKDFKGLGAATYSLNYTDRTIRRGVYTFCMCPGGEVVNASSEDGMLVLNGMSYSTRSLPFSNGGLVVTCKIDDYPSGSPLAGFEFQKKIERNAFHAGGSKWSAPAQNLLDFLGDGGTADVNKSSYKMGVVPADLKEIYPEFVTRQLLEAFKKWKQEVPLFVSSHALLIAAETRTSSPIRITRSDRFESVNTENLYPIGEGSGYTGGITSSAADAIRAVEAYLQGSL